MAVKPYWGPKPDSPAYKAGLRPSDVVTAIDNESPNVSGRALLVWFLMRHEPGETVLLTVRDAKGGERKVSYVLPRRGEG
jgi:C-terminal processing protease CtpA/Prc